MSDGPYLALQSWVTGSCLALTVPCRSLLLRKATRHGEGPIPSVFRTDLARNGKGQNDAVFRAVSESKKICFLN